MVPATRLPVAGRRHLVDLERPSHSGGRELASATKVQAPLDDVLRGFSRDDPNYYTAGLFARFLIERHSLEQFVQFLQEAGSDVSFDASRPFSFGCLRS